MAGVGQRPVVVTAVDDAVLRAVYTFPFLTPEQLVLLRYSHGSLTYARDRLRRLFRAGYLQRCHAPSFTAHGKAPFAYRLARKGYQYCGEAGLEIRGVPHRSRDVTISSPTMCHGIAVNAVLIAARLLERQVCGITVDAVLHEQALLRSGRMVAHGTGGKGAGDAELQSVVPDGWIDCRLHSSPGASVRAPLWLEVDRATEGVRAFKRKIRGILAFLDHGHYEDLFGTHFVTIVVAIDASSCRTEMGVERRVREIRRWIEDELRGLGRMRDGELFAVGTLPSPALLDPQTFFCAPVWSQPCAPAPVALLQAPGSAIVTHRLTGVPATRTTTLFPTT